MLPSLIPQGTHPQLQVSIHFRGAIPEIGVPAPLPELKPLPIQSLILLAKSWQERLDGGEVIRSELAEEHECSRPRVTQILKLLHLSSETQEIILAANPIEVGERGVTERALRPILGDSPAKQLEIVKGMICKARQGKGLRLQRLRRGCVNSEGT